MTEGQEKEKTARLTVTQQLQQMGVAEKIHLSLRADKEARSILIKDPNKQVALSVLSSPKITEQEIELFAQSKSVHEDILKEIAKKKEWVQSYPVILALASNPRTPAGIALSFLQRLRIHDLSLLAKNRNVPEAIRSSAEKALKAKQKNL